jgi:hypothetical protein
MINLVLAVLTALCVSTFAAPGVAILCGALALVACFVMDILFAR